MISCPGKGGENTSNCFVLILTLVLTLGKQVELVKILGVLDSDQSSDLISGGLSTKNVLDLDTGLSTPPPLPPCRFSVLFKLLHNSTEETNVLSEPKFVFVF